MNVGQNREPVREVQLVHEAAESLRAIGWKVEEEPLVGHVRPDLIAVSPNDNHVFVVEFKVGKSPSVHFGALAQLAQYREAVASAKHGRVTPILVTNAAIHEQVQDVADGLGIRVFSGAPDTLPTTLFSGLQPLAD
ncbi:MAG TPA: hypothetical protein VHJ76_07340 [Actinomycetota bacterium]|nr:hypothetical protein [Actinomycetota bacterium]